ncbi:response regulator, partial [Myxococcota bacterium]|nr:response regulator [Myxococcota bacterium]
ARRSAALTAQLLAFARKQPVVPRRLDLNARVEGMLKMLGRLIGEDIELVWLPGAGIGTILMDPSQLDQVLANLCVNSRDAIEGSGRITIETADVDLAETDCATMSDTAVPGPYVMLKVSDTGQGMDEETRSRLFEPFFTTKALGKGTGLGLATIHGIVSQNNGSICVRSEVGEGTTFRIFLPRQIEPTAAVVPEAAHADAFGTETLLLVEDEPEILHVARRILERHGYRVLIASTPAEAIRQATGHAAEIRLLVSDVIMPEMNGRDLAGRLGALIPGLKCLFMSGYTADYIAHHGVLDEGVHFIQKPFTKKAFTEMVRQVLDS